MKVMAFGPMAVKVKGNGSLKKTKLPFSLWHRQVMGAKEDESRN